MNRAPTANARTEAIKSSNEPISEQQQQQQDVWSLQEIHVAEEACDSELQAVEAKARRLAPMRHGSCGAPVPLLIESLGSAGGARITPAATANCAFASRLYRWLETVARPAARRTLGSDIAVLHNASSYMCRNRYNDPGEKISEHAFANALDISAVSLVDGRRIDVATYWGKVRQSALATRALSQNAQSDNLKSRAVVTNAQSGVSPSHATTTASSDVLSVRTPELSFLAELHRGACGIFTTVLGPDANAAHHDHLHFDMKSRPGAAYCQ